jgi:5'-3' exonuclease
VKTTLLIDADIVAFKFASVNEQSFNWGDGVTSKVVTEDFDKIKRETRAYIEGLLPRLKADDYIICLSDDDHNWRKRVLPSYKQHRLNSVRPEWLYPLKEHLKEDYPSYRKPTLEADDVMGILSTHPKLLPGRKIIVSEDKDMKTIPGWLFNPRKDSKAWKVSPEEADYWHMLQTLIGDPTDGYKGCPGVGRGTAEPALRELLKLVPTHREITRGKRKGEIETTYEKEPADSMWDVVVSYYHSKDLTEYDARTQARVARICRHTDYDFKNKEVIYWTPPKT